MFAFLFQDSKITGKALLEVYVSHFEARDSNSAPPKRKVGRPRIHPIGENNASAKKQKTSLPTTPKLPATPKLPPTPTLTPRNNVNEGQRGTTPSIKIYDDHRDKQWSDSMLTHLLQCGQTATARQLAGEKSDFGTILLDEWKKIYPCSSLTSRNLK